MLRWCFILLVAALLPAQDLRIQILATTDTHGRILPEDTYTRQSATQGWGRLATLIRARRAQNPATLLVDCGDTTQGEPVNYVHARLRPDLPEPAVAVMNALGYQAMTVGNHDLDWGLEVLRRTEEQAKFPWLSANLVRADTGKPAFTPYVISEVAGIRVAVVGLTTSALPRIMDARARSGLQTLDAVETARTLVPRLRKEERADVVVLAYHGGLGQANAPRMAEHQGLALAEQVPGVDLVLLGHSHQAHTLRSATGVPILQPQPYGGSLGIAEMTLLRAGSGWKVKAVALQQAVPEGDTAVDPEVLALTAALREETDRYLDTYATRLATDLDGRWSRMEDSAILQLFHRVQRQATGAQLSIAFSPSTRYFVPQGPTSVRQFWALMPYENRIARIRLTGRQVRLWLEHAARYYRFSHEPELINPAVPGYDFDMVDGVSYALDLSRPVGRRVVRLEYKGQPVKGDETFTVAVNTYRLAGGGGYAEAVGLTGEPEFVHPESLRNLMLGYVLARPVLELPREDQWRLIPALDRERILAQAR